MKTIFASDFDNTLYFRGSFRETDCKAISDFQKDGMFFGLATGRSLEGILTPTKGQIDCDFYLLVTGSYLLSKNKELFYNKPIGEEEALRFLREYEDRFSIALNTGKEYLPYSDPLCCFHKEGPLSSDPIYCLSVYTGSEEKAKEEKRIIEKNYPSFTAHRNGEFLDITDCTCSKGTAIDRLRKRIPGGRIFAIGDNENDIPLLEASDVAFTFYSSSDSVKSYADYLVDSVEEALAIVRRLTQESR